MGLTSLNTVIAAVVLLVFLTAATLALWRPAEAARTLRWPLRAGMVMACQLVAVMVAGLAINHVYSFYGSWSELLGKRAQSAGALLATTQLDNQLGPQLRADFASGQGTVVTIAVPGTRSHVPTLPALVYLPAAYGNPAYAGRSFPVVELLAGFPGSPRTWITAMNITSILDEQIASGHSAPFIAVIPSEFPKPRHDTECVNAVGGYQMDTYLAYDVRSATEQAVRASRDDAQWAAMGYSTGGYCAANLAFGHPDLFHAAVSIAGYIHPDWNGGTGNLLGNDVQAAQLNNIVWREQNLPAPRLDLLLVASMQDPTSVAENQWVSHAARSPMAVYTLTLRRGGHNAGTFRAELPTCLAWLSLRVAVPLAPMPEVDGFLPVPSMPKLVHRPQPLHHGTGPLKAAGTPSSTTETRTTKHG